MDLQIWSFSSWGTERTTSEQVHFHPEGIPSPNCFKLSSVRPFSPSFFFLSFWRIRQIAHSPFGFKANTPCREMTYVDTGRTRREIFHKLTLSPIYRDCKRRQDQKTKKWMLASVCEDEGKRDEEAASSLTSLENRTFLYSNIITTDNASENAPL